MELDANVGDKMLLPADVPLSVASNSQLGEDFCLFICSTNQKTLEVEANQMKLEQLYTKCSEYLRKGEHYEQALLDSQSMLDISFSIHDATNIWRPTSFVCIAHAYSNLSRKMRKEENWAAWNKYRHEAFILFKHAIQAYANIEYDTKNTQHTFTYYHGLIHALYGYSALLALEFGFEKAAKETKLAAEAKMKEAKSNVKHKKFHVIILIFRTWTFWSRCGWTSILKLTLTCLNLIAMSMKIMLCLRLAASDTSMCFVNKFTCNLNWHCMIIYYWNKFL
jgi:hypothetical protein